MHTHTLSLIHTISLRLSPFSLSISHTHARVRALITTANISAWAPKSKSELQAVIAACLKAPADCSKGSNAFSSTGPISSWDVSKVTNMQDMFEKATSFTGDIHKWDVSRVTIMEDMFLEAKVFTGDLSKWDMSRVANMQEMFKRAERFNGDISKWDVSRVNNMQEMFQEAKSFTGGDLSKWDVARVTNMREMFYKASSFNGDLSKWDVSRVTTMHKMFKHAGRFARTLCGAWKRSKANKEDIFGHSSGKFCTTGNDYARMPARKKDGWAD